MTYLRRTSQIVTPLALVLMVLPGYAQEPESKMSQDVRLIVAIDSVTKADTLPTSPNEALFPEHFPKREISLDEGMEVVVVYCTIVSVESGYVGNAGIPSLVDSDGNEYRRAISNYTFSIRPPVPPVEGVAGVFIEGDSFNEIFVVPIEPAPSRMKWSYAYWDSPNSESFEVGVVEIDFDEPPR